MQKKKLVLALLSVGAIGLAGLLTACGGGGSSSGGGNSSGGTTPPAVGTVNMFVTDGPSDTFQHVWVTVTAISFHTDPNAVWSSSDATWQTVTLAAPQTIDLAMLNNGALNNVFAGLSLPAGTYQQVRFLFASDEDPLSSSAQAINDNQASPIPLQWNDQVEYLNSSGVVSEAPLEIANPVQGIKLLGTFNVVAGTPLNVATDFDLDRIIVPFRHGNINSFTIKPDLRYFNLNNSGAITGNVGTGLCPTPITSAPAANCAFNLIVHAEASNGTRYEDVRSTTVDSNGNFTLAPLAINDGNGNPISYDIVVRGRQMQTLVITGVPSAGTYTFDSTSNTETVTGGTALQVSTSPLPVTIENEYATNLATALNPLTSGQAVFQQTLTSGGLPHEIRWAATNPFTGMIDRSFFAPWNQEFFMANAGLSVAAFNTAGLSFAPVTPVEGPGDYSVITNEHVYYNFGTAASLISVLTAYPTANALTPTTFAENSPTLASNIVSGTVTGTVDFGVLPTRADNATVSGADVVIARDGAIISTTPIPGSDVTANGTYNYTFTGIGAGSSTTPVPGAYYYTYVRLYFSDGSHKSYPMSGYADLRTTNSATGMSVTVTQ